MARVRNGVPTALYLAKRLCQFLAKYQSIIIVAFPSNTALHAALAAASAACSTLADELEQVRDYGV